MANEVGQSHFAHKRASVSSRREQREKDRGSVLHKLRQSQYVGRTPMSKQSEDTNDTGLKKGAWSPEEDQKLMAYIRRYGIWNWTHMPKAAGLARSGKSCRLRWLNYLRPNIKHGNFSSEEEEAIIKWHQLLGNKWSTIAGKLPGRTDNEIKNYWNSRLKKHMGSEKSARAPTNHPRSQVAVVPPPNTKPSNNCHPNILESSSQVARLGTSPSTSKALESEETSKNSLPTVGIDNKVVGDSDDVSSSILPEAVEGMELDSWEKIFLSPLEDDFETMFMASSWLELPVNYCPANSSTDGYLVYDNLWEN